MTAAVHLYDLLQQRRAEGSTLRFQVSEDWQQGRTVFGGLMTALAVQAMRDIAGAGWPADVSLRALQTNFIGPVSPGVAEIEVHTLREGKNVRQVQATLRQRGDIAAVFVGVFGAPRDSSLPALQPERPTLAITPDEVPSLPFLPGLTPAFTQHIDFRTAEGAIPFTGGKNWNTKIYMQLRPGEIDPKTAHLDELLTVIFADAAPTPALGRLTRPAAASSVSWALELRPLGQRVASDGWWRVDKEAIAVGDGYVNERSTLWAPDGSLAAYGYQVVAVYA
jgi:acyl-CoA thioesterase